jgi:hydroxyacylglutathione hydrolase/adenylyltransferase/sulfurtransferase
VSVSQENGIELAPERLGEWLDEREVELIDVREPREFEAGHLRGSRQVGFDHVVSEAGSLDRGKPLVLVCRSGNRSGMVAEAFRADGFDAYHLTGGLLAWEEAGLPLEPAEGRVVERSIADL